jgi:hypothetical protein
MIMLLSFYANIERRCIFFLCWCRDRRLNIPSSLDSTIERQTANRGSGIFQPILEDFGLSESRDLVEIATVATLLAERNPGTIRWLIISVIVNPLDRKPVLISVLQSPLPENEIVPQPFITNHNASRTIPGIILVPRIPTPILHGRPDIVEQGMAITMLGVSIPGSLFLKTTARLRATISKMINRDIGFVSAITLTFTEEARFSVNKTLNN